MKVVGQSLAEGHSREDGMELEAKVHRAEGTPGPFFCRLTVVFPSYTAPIPVTTRVSIHCNQSFRLHLQLDTLHTNHPSNIT